MLLGQSGRLVLEMDVTDEMFEWLRSYFPDLGADERREGMVTLSASVSAQLESGFLLPVIIKHLLTLEGNALLLPELETLEDTKGTTRVYNWGVVLQALESLSVHLDPEVRELILAGDREIVVEVLEALQAREAELKTDAAEPRKFRRPRQAPDGALFVESIDVRRPLGEAETCLEFLLVAFCSHLQVTQRQAAGLMTEGGRFLAAVLGKGLKGDFLPVIRMLDDIRNNARQLVDCILREAKNGSFVLVASSLRPGLISLDDGVIQATALCFRDLAKRLNEQKWSMWPWFTGELGGVDAAVHALTSGNATTLRDVTEMLYEVSRGRLDEMLMGLVQREVHDNQQFMRLIAEMTQSISTIHGGTESLVTSGILRSLLDLCLKEGDNDSKQTLNLRLSALNLLSLLWRQFHRDIDKNEDLRSAILSLLKKGCRDKSKLVSGCCTAQLFHLLDYFYEQKNHAASSLYKALQLLLIETFDKSLYREFMLESFALTAQQIPSLPVGELVEAVTKQALMSETELNTFDFDFLISIARHPRLQEHHAVMMLDLLGKVYLRHLHCAHAAAIPFVILTSRFLQAASLQEYIYRFAKLAVQLVTQGEHTKQPTKARFDKPLVLGQALSLEDLLEETNMLQTRNLVLDLLSKVIQLSCTQLNERLKEVLATNAVNAKMVRGAYPRGLMVVLGLMGSAEHIMAQYEPMVLQLVWKPPPHSPVRTLALPASKPQSKPQALSEKNLKSVDKLKLLWDQKAEAAKTGQALILDTAPVQPPDLTVELSPEDRSHVDTLLAKYSRLLRHLFKTHAGVGYHKGIRGATFEHLAGKLEAMSEGELLAMLRGLGISQQLLCKEDFGVLLKAFLKQHNTKEPGSVDFAGFKEMLVRVAVFCGDRPGRRLGHLPPVLQLQTLFNDFRSAVAQTGADTLMYDEPFIGHGDKEVLVRLNLQLAQDPNRPLPSGYRAKAGNDVLVEYRVPEGLGLSQAWCECLEVMDSVACSSLQFHVLEPLIRIQPINIATEEQVMNPRLGRLPAGLRFEALRSDDPDLQECAVLLDDLFHSVELKSLVKPRDKPTPLESQKAEQETQARQEREKAEQLHRVRRDAMLKRTAELALKKQQERGQQEAETLKAE